jgi:DNA-binding Xre family transcriptional regulator
MIHAGIAYRMATFRDMVLLEIERAGSVRELSRQTKINHETLNKIANGESVPVTFKTIKQLSDHTGVNFITLVELAYPEQAEQAAALSAESRALAETIERLPENLREAVWALIRGASK